MNEWIEHPKPLPPGMAQGWLALYNKKIFCAVYQQTSGGAFILAYRKQGEKRVSVEKHITFGLAQQRANEMLNNTRLLREMHHGSQIRQDQRRIG